MKQRTPLTHINKNSDGSDAPMTYRVRRRRSVKEKRRIVEETFVSGASVAIVARKHEVNANQVFAWRREYKNGKLGRGTAVQEFVPVGVVDEDSILRPVKPKPLATELPVRRRRGKAAKLTPSWLLEVELQNGIRVRIADGADEQEMRRALVLARDLL
jgi:transposase-like protein